MSIDIQPENHHPKNILERQTDDFIEENFGWDLDIISDYKTAMSLIRAQSYEYRKLAHRLEFLERLNFRFKKAYDNHYSRCKAIKRGEICRLNVFFEDLLFFLQNELEDVKSNLPNSDFSNTEKMSSNIAIDEIINEINKLQAGQQVIYEDVIKEVEELKTLYFLGKKHWFQLFAGKLTEMTAGGIISETVSKGLLKLVEGYYKTKFDF